MLQNVQTTNMNLKNYKSIKSLSIHAFFCICSVIIPSFNVLNCHFCFTQFGGSSYCLNFDKFCDTALLTFLTFATNTSPQLNSLVRLIVIYCVFQTLWRKLFKRKCKPNNMSEERHKIYNL